MRRWVGLSTIAILLGSLNSAWGHGCEELGHHWEVPAYRIEMLTQIELMLGISLVAIAGVLAKNAIARRRAKQ